MTALDQIDGLYIGQLSPEEMKTLERAVEARQAVWSYEGAGALLGLAKVRVLREVGR